MPEKSQRIFFILAAVLVLAVGITSRALSKREITARQMEKLTQEFNTLTQTINPERIDALAFDAYDSEKPQFQRLSRQLRAWAGTMGWNSAMVLARRDGLVFSGPHSLEPEDPEALPPGSSLPHNYIPHRVIEQGLPRIVLPEKSGSDTSISAFIPLIEPRAGRVYAVLAVKLDGSAWLQQIRRSETNAGLGILVLLTLLLSGYLLLRWREKLAPAKRRKYHFIEAFICALMLFGLTVIVSRTVDAFEKRSRQESFLLLARAQADGLVQELLQMRARLGYLASYFAASEFIDQDEFARFAGRLMHDNSARGWLWLPKIPAAELSAHEQEARQGGLPSYRVWRAATPGEPLKLESDDSYYPARYIFPLEPHLSGLGHDLGSEPVRRAALDEAGATGLVAATDALNLFALAENPRGIFVFQPAGNKRQRGFVGVALQLEELMKRILTGAGSLESGLSAGLFQLQHGAKPFYLTAFPPMHSGDDCWNNADDSLRLVVPVFVFGKTYALHFHPDGGWLSAHPLRLGGLTALIGAAFSLFISVFILFLSNRRAVLEREVSLRTAELQQAEMLYRELYEQAPIAYQSLDAHGNLLIVNNTWLELLGYSRGEVLGRCFADFLVPEQKELFRQRFAYFKTKGRVEVEFDMLTADGGRKTMAFSGRVAYDEDGAFKQTHCVFQDVSARKKAEEEKAKLREQLQQAQKMESVGRLAGGVAHDFNNKLGVILGYAEIAMSRLDPGDEAARELQEIMKAARHSAELTRQLLAFARRQTIAPRRIDLNDTIGGMLNMLRRLIGEDIDLVWKPCSKPWQVNLDPHQVDQILANLAVNARDAIEGVGVVTLETANTVVAEEHSELLPEMKPGRYLRLTVSDNGRGMNKEVQAHLFEPFFTTKEVGKGTGLGLATVYGIVRQNDGFIKVYSEPGQGTVFNIYFPAEAGAEEEADDPTPGVVPAGGSETVLLVEDEIQILHLARAILEKYGYRVLAAEFPAAALEMAEQHRGKIDLLLSDVIMPQMNGRKLFELVRETHPGIRVLFISGYPASAIDRGAVLEQGVPLLQKPFAVHELAVAVRQVLDAPGT